MKSVAPTSSTEALAWLMARGVLRALLIVAILALGVVTIPRLTGQELLGVQGRSMGDALPHGSLVVGSSRSAEDVNAGDIVVVQSAPGSVQIVHRVVKLETEAGKRLATTRGDANNAVDPQPFELGDSVTVPGFVIPYLGFLLIFVTTPLGWLLGIAIPSTVVTFLMIRDIWREEEAGGAPLGPAGDGTHWTTRYGIETASD